MKMENGEAKLSRPKQRHSTIVPKWWIFIIVITHPKDDQPSCLPPSSIYRGRDLFGVRYIPPDFNAVTDLDVRTSRTLAYGHRRDSHVENNENGIQFHILWREIKI
jgi:hypothetical protein